METETEKYDQKFYTSGGQMVKKCKKKNVTTKLLKSIYF